MHIYTSCGGIIIVVLDLITFTPKSHLTNISNDGKEKKEK